ncbi:Rieske (2Fe-2S) protein [Streptomyces coeruleoprunus]|uniref:Cytochrome bc1 complex Rieske iron-sulfur subunit n=1 Tax=Streptomyces coeruleoprunus TaxID=285563 RepID=A0ABV9XAV5_9ACTN
MTASPAPRRRTVLVTALAVAVPVTALASGCGDGDGGGGGTASPTTGTAPPAGGKDLVATSEVPVGGGVVLAAEKVVVTQPRQGDFKAFSAICTHQRCLVARVADGLIQCDCHGSRFRIADASVARGPATRPLPPERITVAENRIRLD